MRKSLSKLCDSVPRVVNVCSVPRVVNVCSVPRVVKNVFRAWCGECVFSVSCGELRYVLIRSVLFGIKAAI